MYVRGASCALTAPAHTPALRHLRREFYNAAHALVSLHSARPFEDDDEFVLLPSTNAQTGESKERVPLPAAAALCSSSVAPRSVLNEL